MKTSCTILILFISNILPISGRRRIPRPKIDEVLRANFMKSFDTSFARTSNHSSFELPSRSSHLVETLPYLDPEDFHTAQYAGHIPTSTMDRQFFYWLFEPAKADASTPLVIWLNGGPGCSSMAGLFLENGPFRLEVKDKKWSLKTNPLSWHKLPAYMLYIDQPVGTGLSFDKKSRYCTDDKCINVDFYQFLQNFLRVHSSVFVNRQSKSLNRKLYFTGESYAGHYIPSIMNYILHHNNNIKDIRINLSGAAIGNGWVDPYHQYGVSVAAYSEGVIDLSQWAKLSEMEKQCQEYLRKGINHFVCNQLMDHVLHNCDSERALSPYDSLVWGSAKYPPGVTALEAYLGFDTVDPPMKEDITETVLEAIHASAVTEVNQVFKECANPPFFALMNQDSLGVVKELVHVLDSDINVLFYNGMRDFACNHVGNEVMLKNLPWKFTEDFFSSARGTWKLRHDSAPVGYVRSHKNLHFIKIKEAGHLVPMDAPFVAFEMMKMFLTQDPGTTFNSLMKQQIEPKVTDFGMCEIESFAKQKFHHPQNLRFDKRKTIHKHGMIHKHGI